MDRAGARPPGRTLPRDCEIVVIGAGVAGLCVALYLARAGREVAAIERGEPWGDASGANAGTLSLQVKHPALWDVSREAIDLWEELARELGAGIGFARPGGLRVATSEGEHARLRESVRAQRAHGLEVGMLEGAALAAAAPWLGPAVCAAAHCPEDAYSVPLTAGQTLVDAVRASGAPVVPHAGVTGMVRGDRGFRVETVVGPIACRAVVIAAGAWTGAVAAMLGVTLPVLVDINMLTITESAPPLIDKVITHVGSVLSLKQYANGTCMIGGGWQGRGEVATGGKELDYENLLHNLRIAAEVVPALADRHVVRSWSGYEAVAPDALPLLGPLPGCDGAFVAACARGGYTLAPALGRRLAEAIAAGRNAAPIPAFDPARLAA